MAAGSIRERGGWLYVRTRVQVIDPETGEVRWQQVEKAAGSSKLQAQKVLRSLQADADDGRYVPSALTVLELGRRWLSEHVQPNLKAGGVFRRYADRAGLPETIRLYDLRHTAITNAISQGEDILIVAAFADHAMTSRE